MMLHDIVNICNLYVSHSYYEASWEVHDAKSVMM
jgi:hypothetical protein